MWASFSLCFLTAWHFLVESFLYPCNASHGHTALKKYFPCMLSSRRDVSSGKGTSGYFWIHNTCFQIDWFIQMLLYILQVLTFVSFADMFSLSRLTIIEVHILSPPLSHCFSACVSPFSLLVLLLWRWVASIMAPSAHLFPVPTAAPSPLTASGNLSVFTFFKLLFCFFICFCVVSATFRKSAAVVYSLKFCVRHTCV